MELNINKQIEIKLNLNSEELIYFKAGINILLGLHPPYESPTTNHEYLQLFDELTNKLRGV